ncbi:MAG: hypothetical protein M1822_001731 [Bathelium mastoideum]|nr:MAG: hypothetical protein M1822_001731 [Bathelium mastoideum]
MSYWDPDYDVVGTRFRSRLGAILLLQELYDKTRTKKRKGRLVRRVSYPIVGKPPREPIQMDDRFEIRDFAAFLDDFRVDYEDIYARPQLYHDLVQGFEHLGFWHFLHRYPENQYLQRLHNLYKRYFYLLIPYYYLPWRIVSQRIQDEDFQAATTLERFSFLVWNTVRGFSALPARPSDQTSRTPQHRTLHGPSSKNLRVGQPSRDPAKTDRRVRFGPVEYLEIPKANLGRPVRDLWEDLRRTIYESLNYVEDDESIPEIVDDESAEGQEVDEAVDEGDDSGTDDLVIHESVESPMSTVEVVPEDTIVPEFSDDYMSSSEYMEEIMSDSFDVAHAMDHVMATSVRDREVSPPRIRIGTSSPKKGSSDKDPSSGDSCLMHGARHGSPPPQRIRAETPGAEKRAFDEDTSSEGDYSPHDTLSDSQAEGGVSLGSPRKRVRQHPPGMALVAMRGIWRAFGPKERWPACVEIAIPSLSSKLLTFSQQPGTYIQFGNKPPYEARFDGRRWVRKPVLRSGKKRWKIVATYRGLQEKGSEILSRLNQWDAERNLVRYVSKATPLPPKQWSDSKGKTPVYKIFEALRAAQSSKANDQTAPYRTSRIDSAVGGLRKASVDHFLPRKRKQRRWIIDTDACKLKRVPCKKPPRASEVIDKRLSTLARFEKKDPNFGQVDIGSVLCTSGQPVQNLHCSTIAIRAQLSLGERYSWQPRYVREIIPAPFDPFLAANEARRYLSQAMASLATPAPADSSMTFPPYPGAVKGERRLDLSRHELDDILQDTKMVRNWSEPELADTLAPGLFDEELEAIRAEESGSKSVQEENVQSPTRDSSRSESMSQTDSQESDWLSPPSALLREFPGFGSAGGTFEILEEDMEVYIDLSDYADSDVEMNFRRPPPHLLRPSRRRRRGAFSKHQEVKFPWDGLRGGADEGARSDYENDGDDEYSSSSSNQDYEIDQQEMGLEERHCGCRQRIPLLENEASHHHWDGLRSHPVHDGDCIPDRRDKYQFIRKWLQYLSPGYSTLQLPRLFNFNSSNAKYGALACKGAKRLASESDRELRSQGLRMRSSSLPNHAFSSPTSDSKDHLVAPPNPYNEAENVHRTGLQLPDYRPTDDARIKPIRGSLQEAGCLRGAPGRAGHEGSSKDEASPHSFSGSTLVSSEGCASSESV